MRYTRLQASRLEHFILPTPSLAGKAGAGREADRPPTTQEIYDLYQRSRQKTIAKLEEIPLKARWRTGQNEEFGPVTIRQQVSYFATHECTHLPQLERGRQNLAGVER